MAWRLTEVAFSLLNYDEIYEMNLCRPHNSNAFDSGRSMLPTAVSMSSPPQDAHNVSDDRIAPQARHRNVQYETTPDGDVVIVVQPSFDEDSRKTPTLSSMKEWQQQARSPSHDAKEVEYEARNPSSPPSHPSQRDPHRSHSPPPQHDPHRSHSRNLSAHFFDATSLSDNPVVHKDDEEGTRKHRRMFSGDVSNPATAHRRINSRGNVASVKREDSRQHHHHHREHSAGLDILSAAVDVTKDELAEAAGPPASTIAPWDPPTNTQQQRPSIGHVSTESYDQPAYSGHHSFSMAPPHRRLASGHYPQQHASFVPPGPQQSYHPHAGQVHSGQPHPGQQQFYYHGGYPSQHGPPHDYPSQFPQQGMMMHKQSMYPSQESRPPQDRHDDRMYPVRSAPQAPPRQWNAATHQGSQTFVTGLAVDPGNKTMVPTSVRRDDPAPTAVPSQIGHHRKLSSFSSLGTMFPSAMADRSSGHHRKTSSSVSFLQDLDVGLESTDAAFLRNLQASNSSVATGYASSMPKHTSPPRERASSVDSSQSGTKLASGGTSKRVRRKCTIDNCPNRVVQGGLCISHGAKRKSCRHAGCDKNVKKAGLCSTHGPARKRCEEGNCQKVAVQAGRCIAHGAKKKLCSFDDCTKQAILTGMCKKHHDQSNGIASTKSRSSSSEEEDETMVCQETTKPPAMRLSAGQRKKANHTRGLSIFQELSADAVSSMLNDAPGEPVAVARPESRKSPVLDDNPW
jgi:hypothetical protein